MLVCLHKVILRVWSDSFGPENGFLHDKTESVYNKNVF